MARESRGQKVSTFKHFEPDDTGTGHEKIGTVYFEARNGTFAIYPPAHIAPAAREIYPGDDYERREGFSGIDKDGTVRATNIEKVKSVYAAVLARYEQEMKNRTMEPVLCVMFKSNLPWRSNEHKHVFRSGQAVTSDDISFAGSPTIHLSYCKRWRSKNTLYQRYDRDPTGATDDVRYEYAGKIERDYCRDYGRIVPWTQEREDFFARIHDNLLKLGYMMVDFFQDLDGNLAYALANGGQLAIAPPKEEPTMRVRMRARESSNEDEWANQTIAGSPRQVWRHRRLRRRA